MEGTILLIDDNLDDQFLFKRILAKSGVEAKVESYISASEGLAVLKYKNFDCIFLDYHLPGMDGMAFLKEVRKAHLETPVIMFTGQHDEKVMIRLMQEGAVDYISKNALNEDVLRISIQNARQLSQARLQKRLAEEALINSEASLAEAQRIAHVGNWEYNFNTRKLTLSEEARKLLGYHSEKVHPDFHFLRFVESADLFRVLLAMKNKKDLDQHDVTFRYRFPGSEMKYIHAKGYVIRDDRTGVHISKGTIQDVTIVKQALNDLQKAMIGRKATTIVFGVAIIVFLVSEALLDPFVDRLQTSLLIALSFKGGLALFLKPIEAFLEKFMISKVIIV